MNSYEAEYMLWAQSVSPAAQQGRSQILDLDRKARLETEARRAAHMVDLAEECSMDPEAVVEAYPRPCSHDQLVSEVVDLRMSSHITRMKRDRARVLAARGAEKAWRHVAANLVGAGELERRLSPLVGMTTVGEVAGPVTLPRRSQGAARGNRRSKQRSR